MPSDAVICKTFSTIWRKCVVYYWYTGGAGRCRHLQFSQMLSDAVWCCPV